MFLTNVNLYSQWIQQSSPTTQNLYDVEFLNAKTGWALGDAGVVIKTTDGGLNWVNITNPAIGKPLTSVHIIDSNNVWIVGWFETIIKTTNSGNNWIEIRNGPFGQGNSFECLDFIDIYTGWIAGRRYVFKTTDGGITFDSIMPTTQTLFYNDIKFINATTGILLEEGAVFKTTNAGENWINTNVPTGGNISFFRKLGLAEQSYIWVGGTNAIIFRSSDLGNSWVRSDTIPNTGIAGIDFINRNTGFAGGGLNKLFKTTDGGFNWWQENTGTGIVAFISSIRFINNDTGWYVSGAGKIFHTKSGGQPHVNISNEITQSVSGFNLHQNYPNPFNPVTTIEFAISSREFIKLDIYDINGREIDRLVNEMLDPGVYKINWNGEKYSSGIYLYEISNANLRIMRKMILLK